MIIPYGLEDARVSRLPLVSGAIVAICVLVHAYFWFTSRPDYDEAQDQYDEVIGYWEDHRYLELPTELLEALPDSERTRLDEWHKQAHDTWEIPDPKTLESQQHELDSIWFGVLDELRGGQLKWGYVPANGVAQAGLLTHIFIHADWFHLIGNMFFFFFLVGPFLEDVWGKTLFGVFFLIGGIVAVLFHGALASQAELPVVGASGAVSACVGAFCVRFYTRRVRFLYWLLVAVGTFALPAWIWGILYFGEDLAYLVLSGADAKIAFTAHVGGFVFGLAVAIGMRLGKVEERLKLNPEITEGEKSIDYQLEKASEAVINGDFKEARELFLKAYQLDKTSVRAIAGLAQVSFSMSDLRGGNQWVELLLSSYLAKNDRENFAFYLDMFSDSIEASWMRPNVAAAIERFAQQQQLPGATSAAPGRGNQPPPSKGVQVQRTATAVPGASLTSAQVSPHKGIQVQHIDPNRADPMAAIGLGPSTPSAAEDPMAAIGLGPSTPSAAEDPMAAIGLTPAEPTTTTQAVLCSFVGRSHEGYWVAIDSEGNVPLAPANIVGLGVGVIGRFVDGGQQRSNVVITDLLVQLPSGRRLLRFPSYRLGLNRLYRADVDPKAAHRALIDELAGKSGATLLVPMPPRDRDAIGFFFEDIDEFEAKCKKL